jgi:hypothetical protein
MNKRAAAAGITTRAPFQRLRGGNGVVEEAAHHPGDDKGIGCEGGFGFFGTNFWLIFSVNFEN